MTKQATNKVWVVLDGLMLVHWKDDKTLDILVPNVEAHTKRLIFDGKVQSAPKVTPGTYTLTLDKVSGRPLSMAMPQRHFCLDGVIVKRRPDITQQQPPAEAIFAGLPFPTAAYGLKRYLTLSDTILNGSPSKALMASDFSGHCYFCETVVLEYSAESLTVKPNEGGSATVYESLVIQAIPLNHLAGHQHMEEAGVQPGHGKKQFNEMICINGNEPDLRVTDLSAAEVVKWVDDKAPIELTDLLKAIAIYRTTSPLDCAPNYLIGG